MFQKDIFPPPGGTTLVVVPTLFDVIWRRSYLKHSDLYWMNWAQALDCEVFFPGDLGSVLVWTALGLLCDENVLKISQRAARKGIYRAYSIYGLKPLIEWFESLLPEEDRLVRNTAIRFEKAMPVPSNGYHGKPISRVLAIGFDPSHFPAWVNDRLIDWWTIQEAEQKNIGRNLFRDGIRFVVINGQLRDFTKDRHRQAAASYFSGDNVAVTANDGEMADWLIDLAPRTIRLASSRKPKPKPRVEPTQPKLEKPEPKRRQRKISRPAPDKADEITSKVCFVFGLTRKELTSPRFETSARFAAVLVMRRHEVSFDRIGEIFGLSQNEAAVTALLADMALEGDETLSGQFELVMHLVQ